MPLFHPHPAGGLPLPGALLAPPTCETQGTGRQVPSRCSSGSKSATEATTSRRTTKTKHFPQTSDFVYPVPRRHARRRDCNTQTLLCFALNHTSVAAMAQHGLRGAQLLSHFSIFEIRTHRTVSEKEILGHLKSGGPTRRVLD